MRDGEGKPMLSEGPTLSIDTTGDTGTLYAATAQLELFGTDIATLSLGYLAAPEAANRKYLATVSDLTVAGATLPALMVSYTDATGFRIENLGVIADWLDKRVTLSETAAGEKSAR